MAVSISTACNRTFGSRLINTPSAVGDTSTPASIILSVRAPISSARALVRRTSPPAMAAATA